MSIRRVFSILLLLFASLSVNAQQERYFAKNMILGSSYTWIWVNNLDPVATYLYDEYTWNTNLAVSLSKRVYLGLQLLNIRTIVKDEPSEKFNIYGLFAQYNMLRRTDHRFFIETSINRGNYCTCGDYEPFVKENLYYWGLGIGYDLPLKRILSGLYLDLSFINYHILSQIEKKYNYTQYVVGLNYRLGK